MRPMAAALPEADHRLIGGKYAVDPTRPLSGAGGGLPAFAVADRQGLSGVMAVQVARAMPARAQALRAAAGMTDGMLGPLAHGAGPAGGAGEEAYYVICPAPPGPAVGAAWRAWSESELLECLLRPATQTLARLAARGITHRAIRPDNVFQSAPGQPVVLGQGWAAPPAALQPALFEPPYSAMCLPCGRGEGAIADDVYALGVLMVVLALGLTPLAGIDSARIIRRKLELGSFAAVAGETRLPSAITDLARGMLAEDPEHRPTPSLLLDPGAARARRLATRPSKRAQSPARIGAWSPWDARALAHAIAAHPEPGVAALRAGAVDGWLRRDLGDAALAAKVDEAVRVRPVGEAEPRADALLVMRAVAVLDPLAPLCWRGLALWPDGLGPALVAADRQDGGATEALVEIVNAEIPVHWTAARGRGDIARASAETRQRRAILRARGGSRGSASGGARRLAYALNPLLPCGSTLLGGRVVVHLPDLIPVLDERASRGDPGARPMDADIAAFIAARSEHQTQAELAALALGDGGPMSTQAALAQLELFATLQPRGAPSPALARWLIASPDLLLAGWQSSVRRRELASRLTTLAEAGELAPILALAVDPVGRAADQQEGRVAAAELVRIDAELARIEAGGEARAAAARGLGQEAAAGLALAALALSIAVTLFG